jgi:DNA-binding response OmpR family regulator
MTLRLVGADGFALRDSLLADPRSAHIPVIAMSTTEADYDRGRREGSFAAVLMKPCLPDVLCRRLRHALGVRTGTRCGGRSKVLPALAPQGPHSTRVYVDLFAGVLVLTDATLTGVRSSHRRSAATRHPRGIP